MFLEGVKHIKEEKKFETKIRKFIDECGGWQVKYFANGYTKSGIPDILACVNGYFIAIEVKAENGRISALQTYQIEMIRRAGGFAFVLYPSGYERFKQFINGLLIDEFNKDMEMVMK